MLIKPCSRRSFFSLYIILPFRPQRSSILNTIRVDGTVDGYFQYALFAIRGHQFFQYWHANYDDYYVMCDTNDLFTIKAKASDSGLHIDFPQDLLDKARSIDFSPRVKFVGNSVTVQVVIFSKWEGFSQLTIEFVNGKTNREDWKYFNLIEYDCGWKF